MKKLCVSILFLGVLFLTGCQKNEEIQSLEKESQISFKKEGDPRDPAEFMSPEEIKMIQEIFQGMEGKKYDGSVTRVQDPLTKGSSNDLGDGVYLLEDVAPVLPIDGGEWLYVKALITYNENNLTFTTQINYRVGTKGAFKLGYKSTGNTNTYISGDDIKGKNRILIGDCSFDVPLVNDPNYNTAKVSFPFVMQWDQRVGYEEGCDIIINQNSVRTFYYNK